MIRLILYFFITVSATTVGAMTGMGGGVIIKPILDAFHHYDATTINVLSSLTVLSMAIVSVARHITQHSKFNIKMSVVLAISSVIGGILGSEALNHLLISQENEKSIFLIQNIILSFLLTVIFFYMLRKNSLQTLNFHGIVAYIIVGLLLGLLSAFLGIGGGPINVAVVIFIFGLDTKNAAISSLVVILFSHIAKSSTIIINNEFKKLDLSVLPVMIIGAIIGGLIGTKLQKRFSGKHIDQMFNAIQLFVLTICIINIVNNIN